MLQTLKLTGPKPPPRATLTRGNISGNSHMSTVPAVICSMLTGPVEAMTLRGGQGMSARPGGKLWQRFQASPGKHYLMYAKLNAVRGDVIWSLADPDRNIESKGVVEPSGISEIVSDVVVSQDGELDVSFEVPDGGAFRVLDVIVTEAPTLDGSGTHHSEKILKVSTEPASH